MRALIILVALLTVGTVRAGVTTAVLYGTADTIEWTDTGADRYWMQVGSTDGGTEYHSGSVTGFSLQLDGLPADNSTIYVTYWEQNNGRWTDTQYQLTSLPDQNTGGDTDSAVIEAMFFATPSQVVEAFTFGFSFPLLAYITAWAYGVVIRFASKD